MAFGDVDITEGAGTPVAVDLISGRNYQRFKMVNGAEGSETPLIVTSDGSLQVEQFPRRKHDQISSAGLTIAATAYAANDTTGTGWEFPNYARAAGSGGKITGYTLEDLADIVTAMDFYIFDRSVTFGADNALITATGVSDADGAFFLQKFSIGVDDLTGCRVGAGADNIPYHCNGTSLFVYGVTRVGHTFFGSVADLKLRIYADLD